MKKMLSIIGFCLLAACSGGSDAVFPIAPASNPPESHTYKYLALGDSYTYGQNVCATCRFPEQLKARLLPELEEDASINIDMYAVTGWTTSDLLASIGAGFPTDYDLVTLLIGVNNQYQHKPFSIYETEFPALVNNAITYAHGDASNVIVVSIPDYAFTPYGQGTSNPGGISSEIDDYNNFARSYCQSHSITFVDITDITRLGLENPSLVANDGLHPSEIAYAQFVDRILPKAIAALQ
jgi:acyl-CoA thioesterase-1